MSDNGETETFSKNAAGNLQATGWRFFLGRQRVRLSAVLSVAVFALMGYAIYRLTGEVRYEDVANALRATNSLSIAGAIGFTALSFLALTFYDVDAVEYIGRKLPYTPVAFTAFSAYAVGNTAGFGPLSGGAIRYRAYSRLGLSPDEIGRIIAFVTLAFGLGLAAVAALSLLAIGEEVASITGLSANMLRAISLMILATLTVLFVMGSGGRALKFGQLSIRLPDSRTMARQFLVTAVDIAASASVLYMLLPSSADIGWPAFLAIYSVAVGLGVLSHLPAGLGVFETIIVAGIGRAADVDDIIGSLVLYRIIYHVLPLLVATGLVLTAEVNHRLRHPAFSGLHRLGGRLVPSLLATLSIIAGAMLVFSSVSPLPENDIPMLARITPLWLVEAAHFLSSLVGLTLFLCARGLSQKLDGAWWIAAVATVAAFVLALAQAPDIVHLLVLAFLFIGLLVNRRRFTRPASLVGQALTPAWLMAMMVLCGSALFILFFVYRDVDYSHDLWWQFELEADAPRSLRAMLGLAVSASVISIGSLLRPAKRIVSTPHDQDVLKAVAIVQKQSVADANLVRMNDKSLLFSPEGDAFIMYARQGRSWIALFDPVGPRNRWAELVWRFLEMARADGGRAVFYQVSPSLLGPCADAGLRAFRLGEIATIDLAGFDMKGGRWANLRNAAARGERDGMAFSIVAAEDVPALIDELAEVSDNWLNHHNAKEKGFSLGSFDSQYILSQPVAVLRRNGTVIAFANLLLTETKQESSVDLMRFSQEAPKGAMDMLFVRIITHLRNEGYQKFNLGMAPLSGLSLRDAAPVWDVIGRTVFEHGDRFYNFKGLRAFKEKFHPEWEPRYLAVSGGMSPVVALMDTTLLIGGGLRGVIGK